MSAKIIDGKAFASSLRARVQAQGERLKREPGRPGALRVVYIEQQTGPFSRKVGELISRHLAAVEPAVVEICRRRYRVEVAPVQHSQIARRCLPDLLAEANVEFDWWR